MPTGQSSVSPEARFKSQFLQMTMQGRARAYRWKKCDDAFEQSFCGIHNSHTIMTVIRQTTSSVLISSQGLIGLANSFLVGNLILAAESLKQSMRRGCSFQVKDGRYPEDNIKVASVF
jgi:hypothetical protein